MTGDQPTQPPEGKLISDTLKANQGVVRQLAPRIGITEARWRQIVKGTMSVSGAVTDTRTKDSTLAKMAFVAGVDPEQLAEAGRPEAAKIMHTLASANPGDTITFADGTSDLVRLDSSGAICFVPVRQQRGTSSVAVVTTAKAVGTAHTVDIAGSIGLTDSVSVEQKRLVGPDEIDLIYASQTMSAREKLIRIRQVLELRAQVEAEARAQQKAPASDDTGASATCD